jgi:hypothetical protein
MYKLIKPKLFSFILGFLILSGGALHAADFETWTFVGGQTKIKNMNFFFHSANFFRDGSNYFLNHTQLTLDFPSQKSIGFGVGYKQEYVEFSTGWRAEYRPMLHLYYNKSWGNFSFRDRSRWEFRFYDGELINRYRNQVQLMYKKFNVFSPYVSTEFSFYFNELGYSRQRTILGSFIHVKSVNFNLFFGHQLNEDFPGLWTNKFMLGTGLSYKF